MPPEVPIPTAHLFPKLDHLLEELLHGLSQEEWKLPTIVSGWTIKDIAGHLLDSNVRLLSALRDGHMGPAPAKPIQSYQDLVDHLNQLNATWVNAAKRLSPELLTDLLVHTGKQCSAYWAELPPFDPALFSVAWAGESESQNWFHMAREFTEKWHHQQQIRLAVGKTRALYTEELYGPYLECSMRALPHHYRSVDAPESTTLLFHIHDSQAYRWLLTREASVWRMESLDAEESPGLEPTCTVFIPGEIAWRIFTKGITREEAVEWVRIEGQPALGEHVLKMVAIMG